jgi:hypothetical protein
MQEVPIVAVRVIAVIAGIKSTEAVHGVLVQAAEMPMIAKAGTATVKAVYAGSDVSAAKPADMTDAPTDVSTAKASDRAHPADVPTAAESADMTAAAEAAAHTAPVAATTATAARLCLRRQQARRQQGRRQNGYYLSHHFLHSVVEWCAPLRNPHGTKASDEPKISLPRGLPTKFTFTNSSVPARPPPFAAFFQKERFRLPKGTRARRRFSIQNPFLLKTNLMVAGLGLLISQDE